VSSIYIYIYTTCLFDFNLYRLLLLLQYFVFINYIFCLYGL
jgi:hypothetical protein